MADCSQPLELDTNLKAEAAQEQEVIGAPDEEALSQEEAKPPNILAAGAGYYLAARSKSLAKRRPNLVFFQITFIR